MGKKSRTKAAEHKLQTSDQGYAYAISQNVYVKAGVKTRAGLDHRCGKVLSRNRFEGVILYSIKLGGEVEFFQEIELEGESDGVEIVRQKGICMVCAQPKKTKRCTYGQTSVGIAETCTSILDLRLHV
jgi:hypothetical protein